MQKSPNRLVAVIFGAIYLLIGIIGFFITSDVGFASNEGDTLLGFEINPLHNIVHVVIGAVLLGAGLKSIEMARKANLTVGVVYLLVGIVGLFILDSEHNILALNSADNVLHFLTAAILIAVALLLDKVRHHHDVHDGVNDTGGNYPNTGSPANPGSPPATGPGTPPTNY